MSGSIDLLSSSEDESVLLARQEGEYAETMKKIEDRKS